ncbi:YlxM family DNA-binding protein [Paenibacillus sp. MBLB4367]|uniref:YlxM family DNA-binding protein n=1 Tax=Paenibacillus sp. MBLB4367 TaxID=3384767 RepID=UPI003907FDD3
MQESNVLAKTNRINLLFDFYEQLLTDKQKTFLSCHFHDDFSLGEIAAEYDISRQAVYEHIKRAAQALEDYESKLQLLAKHERRLQCAAEMEALLQMAGDGQNRNEQALTQMKRLLATLRQID